VSQFTPRVANRTALAQLLRDQHMARAVQAGITQADLDVIIDAGTAAAKADAEQQEQLASLSAQRSERKVDKESAFEREDALRNRLPAVIGDLQASGPEGTKLALWLSRLTFARYRFRPQTPAASATPSAPAASPEEPAPTPAEVEEVRRVERVQREDAPTRSAGLTAFCQALLKPGREPIIAAFAARGLTRAEIEALGQAAEALAAAGRNVPLAAEATQRESDAVDAQKARWDQVRRMIRAAASGVPELSAKFSTC